MPHSTPPSDARDIPLGEVLMMFEYPQLFIRFPDASIPAVIAE